MKYKSNDTYNEAITMKPITVYATLKIDCKNEIISINS